MNENVGGLKRTLKLRHIVFLGLAYMAPMAVFDTFGIVSEETGGHVPLSYVLIIIAVLFTAFSYGKMVKVYPTAGSAYTYTRQTISSGLGFLVGWAALLDYLLLPMINALLTKIYLSAGFPGVPGWMWIVGLIVFISIMNIVGVKIAVSVNMLFVMFQVLVVVIFVILTAKTIVTGDTGSFSFQPFFSEGMEMSKIFSGASILALAFLGFDAVTTLSEETIEPKKNVPRGIFLIALIGGLFFLTVTYFMQSLFPDVSHFKDIEGASPEIALFIGGKLFQSVFLAGALISCIASGLASQTSASRLLYAMGRDGVLFKKGFGRVNQRFGTPIFNIVLIGIIALTALFLDLDTATSLINFGAFTAFAFVNLTVIAYFFRKMKTRSTGTVIGYLIAPFIGFVINAYLWYSLNAIAMSVGLIWVAVGLAYLLYLTRFFTKSTPQFDFDEAESM